MTSTPDGEAAVKGDVLGAMTLTDINRSLGVID